jgi:NADH-quinone oxidoreductase subunit M
MQWITLLRAELTVLGDGMSLMLCLLTALVFFIIIVANWNKEVERPHAFYGLMLLSQAGITGVFLSGDALMFYFFWELALIPIYFLCSQWGGPKRIPVTYKFFVYTFLGSLMMLSTIIYLATFTHVGDPYAWANIVQAGKALPPQTQQALFWLLFIAFAIKMPVFPFHTWQPDTYEQSPTPVTIILSAIMVKMGIYGVVRWLMPVLPEAVAFWSNTVIILSIIGILYASVIAFIQTDLKRLVAYSSIAHMGLMCAATFANTTVGMHGLMVQMFNHGINITGMWLIVSMIENRYGTRDMRELGGMATAAPHITIALVILAFANIALPLTNGFIGEFMLFNGIFQSASDYNISFMAIAGIGIILGAVYTLNMVQKTAYGNTVTMVVNKDMTMNESIAMAIIVGLVLFLGVYPKPLLEMTQMVSALLVP